MRRHGWRLAFCFVAALRRARASHAHEFKLDAVINAFVKIEPGEAQLVVRAPLYLFKSVRFPVTAPRSTSTSRRRRIERALPRSRRTSTLFENGRTLTASQRDGAAVAAVRPVVRDLRAGAAARRRADRARHAHLHRPGLRRRPDHLSDCSRRIRSSSIRTTAAPGARRRAQATRALHAAARATAGRWS